MFFSQKHWLLVALGLILSLAPSKQAMAQELRPGDFYWEQIVAALTGAVFFALLPVSITQEAFWGNQPSLWCERQSIAASSIVIGGGAHIGTYAWGRLARRIWGNGGLSLAMAMGGASAAGFYACKVAPHSPWLVLAAQVLAASLLAPLGYNMDAVIVPEEK